MTKTVQGFKIEPAKNHEHTQPKQLKIALQALNVNESTFVPFKKLSLTQIRNCVGNFNKHCEGRLHTITTKIDDEAGIYIWRSK